MPKNIKEAAQEIFDTCKENGFGFGYDPAAEKITVIYRFNQGFTRYSLEQVFDGPLFSDVEPACVNEVAEMIRQGETFKVKNHINEFVPF